MLEDNTPHAFITELFTKSELKLVRDRSLVTQGKWLVRGLTKSSITKFAQSLVDSRIKYSINKSKVYGDVFSFDYSNVSYALNCKTHIITIYFNEAKIR